MSDDLESYRTTRTTDPGSVTVREAEEIGDDERFMEIRLPVASTGEVRNEGDDPLTRSELRGMARQLNDNTIGVFPEHGQSDKIDFAGYSQFEKLGYWTDAEVEREASADGEDMLYATARMLDPEPLPSQTGTFREALAILKEQAVAGVPITTSIGWRGDEDAPGGNDLLEVSIVGMAADPRTGTEGGQQLVARAAIDAGADPETLLENVRAAIDADTRADAPDDARPFGPPNAPNLWDSFEECVSDVQDWESVDDPEAFCGWAQDQTEGQSGDTEDTHDMTEEDDPPADDAGDTTDEEQHADDGEETESRAPDDVALQDFADLLAPSLADADAEALMAAWEEFDYTGGVDMAAVVDFISTVTDADTSAVEDALDDLMGGDQEMDEDEEEEDEEEDENGYDDDRGADGTSDADDSDTDTEQERDADADEDRERTIADEALEQRIDNLEEELAAVRSGDVEIDTDPKDVADELLGDDRDVDDETEDDSEQRDANEDEATPRDEWLSHTKQ